MYKDILNNYNILNNKGISLVDEINKGEVTDYEKLSQLISICLDIIWIKTNMKIANKIYDQNNKNSRVIAKMLFLLDEIEKEEWVCDYVVRDDKFGNCYAFVCLREKDVDLNNKYSFYDLLLQVLNGNIFKGLVVFDILEYDNNFSFEEYLDSTYFNSSNFLNKDCDFSSFYPYLEECVENEVFNIYKRVLKKANREKR